MKKIFLIFVIMLAALVILPGCASEYLSEPEQLKDNNSVLAEGNDSQVDDITEKKIKLVQPKKLEAITKKKLIGEDPDKVFFEPNIELSKANEKLSIYFTLKNISGEPKNLTFSSGQQYDYFVYNSKDEMIYQWSEGKMFTQVIKEVTLEDGDQMTFDSEWNFIDRNGAKVPSDEEYRIEFRVTAKVTTEKGEIIFSSNLSATEKINVNN